MRIVGLKIVGGIGMTIALAMGACNQDDPNKLLGTQGQGGSGGTPVPTKTARELWDEMEPEILAACGDCHEIGGSANTPFLIGPDWYQSFVSWPDIVKKNPLESILLTYAMNGKGHSGKNLDSPSLKDSLLPKVEAWLDAEAKNFTDAPVAAQSKIEPFVPRMGFNAVYLDSLGALYNGIALTFQAKLVTNSTLELNEIEIHPTLEMGVHVVHPLFIVHPLDKDPVPDVVDSFSNVDQTFAAGTSGALGPGTVLLVNWTQDAKMSFAFEKIELVTPSGAPIGGCKDVPAFEMNAKGPMTTCLACHDGTDTQAQAAMDMSALLMDSALACGQIRNRINTTDPAKSQIFINSDPQGNAAHPFHFDGNAAAFDSFKTNVSKWIVLEQ